jgi:UDP-glucose 4-epimerase
MRVIVTGGAGFIGSHLVDELLKRGDEVLVIDNLSNGSKKKIEHNFSNPHFSFVEADIRDAQRMKELCQGIDRVYHLAVQCIRLSINNPDLVHEVNATGTLNMLKAAQANNVKRFVYISSSEIYGTAVTVPMPENHPTEPTTVYGASKLVGEFYTKAFTRTHGMDTIIIRPFNSYGPREYFEGVKGEVIPKFAVRIMHGKQPLIFGDGEQTRDFTYVVETARGMIQAADCDDLVGEVVNLAYGQEVSVKQIAESLLTHFKSDLQVKYCEGRPGEIYRLYADISKAKKLFNFNPQINIDTGIKMYLDWLKTQDVDISKEVEFNWK